MKKLVWIFATFLSVAVVTTAYAGDDSRSKSGGFFSFFTNLFRSSDNHADTDKATSGAQGEADVADSDADVASNTSDDGPKFIYLDDGSGELPEARELPPVKLLTANVGSEVGDKLMPTLRFDLGRNDVDNIWGGPLAFDYITSVERDVRVGISFAKDSPESLLSGLSITFASRVAEQTPALPRFAQGVNFRDGLERQVYNIGVRANYRGFFVGSNFARQQNSFASGYQGFDASIGFQGSNWSTGVQVSKYNKDNDLYALGGSPIGSIDIRAVQIGAAYSWGPWVTFSGQFRYYDYNNRGGPELLLDDAQVFTLGTSLNF